MIFFECVAKFVARLGEVGKCHECHVEHHLFAYPADAYREVAEYQTAHHAERAVEHCRCVQCGELKTVDGKFR